MSPRTRFEKEAKDNSQMAYWFNTFVILSGALTMQDIDKYMHIKLLPA